MQSNDASHSSLPNNSATRFCSRLAMAGASTKAIQELAGHSDLKTTQRYMHLSPKAKRRAVELLDEMLGDIKETAQGSVRNP